MLRTRLALLLALASTLAAAPLRAQPVDAAFKAAYDAAVVREDFASASAQAGSLDRSYGETRSPAASAVRLLNATVYFRGKPATQALAERAAGTLAAWRRVLQLDPNLDVLESAYRLEAWWMLESLDGTLGLAEMILAGVADYSDAVLEIADAKAAHADSYAAAMVEKVAMGGLGAVPWGNLESALRSARASNERAGRTSRAAALASRLDALLAAKSSAQKEDENLFYAYTASSSAEARALLDLLFAHPGYQPTARAFFMKAYVEMRATAETPADPMPHEEIFSAWRRMRSLDPRWTVLASENAPSMITALYRYFGVRGMEAGQAERWAEAADSFDCAVDAADAIAARPGFAEKGGLTDASTFSSAPVVRLAGISNYSAGRSAVGLAYFRRIADQKLSGPDYEVAYQILVKEAFQSGDAAALDQYLALGRELYPESAYFKKDAP